MVSLGDDSRRSGGYFFDRENSVNSEDDEADFPLINNSSLSIQEDDVQFKAINTTWAIALQLFLLLAHVVMSFLIPAMCLTSEGHASKCSQDPYSILIYICAGYWCLLFLFDQYYRLKHNENRCNGYLDFFRETKIIRRGPFLVYSAGGSLLLVILMLLQDYCPTKIECSKSLSLKPFNYVQLVVCLEVLLCLPFLILYLVKTIQFNSKRAPPDVAQDELMSSFMQSHTQSDIGFRDDFFLDEVLEKQADMIRYLKQRNSHLGRKILRLTNEANAKKKSAYF